jgi:fructoselysine-6-P-deglycase FrlB-like protein
MCGCFDSPLAQAAKAHSTGSALEFDIPTGKDGFLATVSLVAFMGLLLKAYQQAFSPAWYLSDLDIQVRAEVQANIIKAMPELAKKRTWMIVYGGWGLPVALDAECKLTEAAMVSTRLIDYRNLAHGHHHWLHRYGQDTAVIALVTPNEAILAEQTLALLPSDIPTLSLTTAAEGPLGTLALMVQLIALVYALGDTIGWSSEQMPVASFAKAMQQLNYQIPMAKTVS